MGHTFLLSLLRFLLRLFACFCSESSQLGKGVGMQAPNPRGHSWGLRD